MKKGWIVIVVIVVVVVVVVVAATRGKDEAKAPERAIEGAVEEVIEGEPTEAERTEIETGAQAVEAARREAMEAAKARQR